MTGGPSQAMLLASALLVSALGGCSILKSTNTSATTAQEPCKSTLGGYYLPIKHLIATVTADESGKQYFLELSDPVAEADPRQFMCLDYLHSWASADKIHVERTAKGLLTSIGSIAEDKTGEIAETLIRIALAGATGHPGPLRQFRDPQGKAILSQFNFDPLDGPELDLANRTLQTYGFCIFVDGQTQTMDAASYCTSLPPAGPPHVASTVPAPEDDGVLYRPEVTYSVAVYRKRDPSLPTATWTLFKTMHVALPNISPPMSVTLERSFFATRTAKLVFKDGVLAEAHLHKPSEALGAAEIPLKVVNAVIQAPASLVKVRLAGLGNQQKLIQAQEKAIQANAALLQAQGKTPIGAPATGGGRSEDSPLARSNRDLPDAPFQERVRASCKLLCAPGDDACVDECFGRGTRRCSENGDLNACLRNSE